MNPLLRLTQIVALLAVACAPARSAAPSNPRPRRSSTEVLRPMVPFAPLAGSLTARVFSNPHVDLPATLFFDIEIPVKPFEFEGTLQTTAVRLGFIEFPVSDWRQLQDREFRFPASPRPGYIDGSVYLGDAHNPCAVTRIRFGPLAGRTLQAEFDLRFDFEYEGPAELGKPAATWTVPLAFDPAQLDEALAEARRLGAISGGR